MEVTTAPQEQPPKLRKIYEYLKQNNLVKSPTYETWEQKMQDPAVAEKTYNYLRDNGKVKSKDFNEFQATVGLKKKEPTIQDQIVPSQPSSDLSSPQLASGLTEEEEKQRNLQQLAQQPVANEKMPLSEAQLLSLQQAFEAPKTPDAAKAQYEQDLIFSPEAGAKRVVRGPEEKSEFFDIANNPGSAIQNAIGSFNKAVVSTVTSLPKSVSIYAKKLNDITGLEEDKPVEEMGMYKLGKFFDDAALDLGITATDPDKADSFWQSDLPAAFGSVAGVLLTGGGTGAGSAVVGGSAMAVPEYEAAKASGLSDDEAFDVYLKNYAVGLSEAVPLQRWLSRMNKVSKGKLAQIALAGGKGALEEGAQEVFQTYLTNKIAQGSYDPERDLMQDVIKSGGAGAFVGFMLPGIHAAMQHMTPEQKAKTNQVLNTTFKEAKSQSDKTTPAGAATAVTELKKEGPVQTPEFVTFEYNSKAEVPEVLKDKISSESEINGETKIRVTIPKSEADKLLSVTQTKTENVQTVKPAGKKKSTAKKKQSKDQPGDDKAAISGGDIKDIQEPGDNVSASTDSGTTTDESKVSKEEVSQQPVSEVINEEQNAPKTREQKTDSAILPTTVEPETAAGTTPVERKEQESGDIQASEINKDNLSQAIETDKQDRSDYVKRRLKEARDNKAFKKDLKNIGQYTVQSMDLANVESDKLISDLQMHFGQTGGLTEAFEALKDDQVPPLMEGPMASKLMLQMQAQGMNKQAIEVLDWLQEGGRDAARRLASLRSDASPESTVSRLFAGLDKAKQNALAKPFKGGQTYEATVADLQKQLDEVNQKYNDLLSSGTIDATLLPDPTPKTETKASDEIIKRAKSLRKEGLNDLNKFFKKQRGQANMGAAVDPDLFKALGKILKSYILEFEGNVMKGFEKFQKDVTDQYKQIDPKELEAIRKELIEANADVIEEFKTKKQLQVIEKILEPEAKETPAERKARKEKARKILDDYKSGKTTDQISENFKDEAGFETVTPEQRAKIVEMTTKYSKYHSEGKNELAYKEWYDLMMYLEDLGLQNRTIHETILDLWYTGVLSGLTTIARSIKGSLLSTTNFATTRLLSSPKVAPLAIAQMLKGLKGASSTYAHIISTGKTNVKLQDFSPKLPRLTDRLWDKKFSDLKTKEKFLKGIYALPTFMYRNIIAFDQILKDAVAEGNIAVFEFNKTDKEKKLSERLKETQERLKNARDLEVRDMVKEEVDIMNKAGEEIPKGYQDRRFREIKNELRDAETVKRAVEDAARASLVSHPIGTLGYFYSYWEKVMDIKDTDPGITKAGKYLLRSVFPFMRIGFNYVNAGLDYTPVGFARALKNSIWTKEGIRPLDNFEKREYFARAAVGMAVAVMLFDSLFDWDDEEGLKLKEQRDRWIEVYGPLTGKWWEYDDVAKDARPWSVRLKNPFTGEWSGVFSYADNPIGFMLAPLGIMHDQIMFNDFKDKAQKKELKDEVKDIGYITGALFHGTFRYAMDQSFNQGMNAIGNLMAPESPEKFSQEIENLALRPAQGFYPSIYRQLYDQYRALSDTPEKQAYSWYEKPARLAPMVDNIVRFNKYDVFGYPVVRDFNFPMIPDMILRQAKQNLDYREGLKEWELLHKYPQVTIGGGFLPPQTYEGKELTNEQKDEFVRVAGVEMKRLVLSHYDALNEMDATKLQNRLIKYKGTATRVAKREVLKQKKPTN